MRTWLLSLRVLIARVLRWRFVVHVHKLDIKGADVKAFGVKEWEGIAELFSRTPGLRNTLEAELGEAIGTLDLVKKTPENFGEVVRHAQRVIELWRFLKIPEKATNELASILARQQAEQSRGDQRDNTQQNVM